MVTIVALYLHLDQGRMHRNEAHPYHSYPMASTAARITRRASCPYPGTRILSEISFTLAQGPPDLRLKKRP